LIEISFLRRKAALLPEADKNKKQNVEHGTLNSEDSKHKNQNHKQTLFSFKFLVLSF
jgi:hypothetical protein